MGKIKTETITDLIMQRDRYNTRAKENVWKAGQARKAKTRAQYHQKAEMYWDKVSQLNHKIRELNQKYIDQNG